LGLSISFRLEARNATSSLKRKKEERGWINWPPGENEVGGEGIWAGKKSNSREWKKKLSEEHSAGRRSSLIGGG